MSNSRSQLEALIILGGGPAGLTAAIYASRSGISPLVVEGKQPGGQLMGTSFIENWPGSKKILGPQLMIDMRSHAEGLGARFLSEDIKRVDFYQQPFTVFTEKEESIRAESVIIATGSNPKRLKCPGEDTYWGKGVTTCAVCDGAFYRDGKVIVIGGGDTAMEDASFMANFTKTITVVHILDKLTASTVMQKRVLENPNTSIIYNSTVTAFEGNGSRLTHAVVTNQRTGESFKMACDVAFVAIGLLPNTAPFKGQIDLEPNGYIITKNHTRTSVNGVFAAGDVADYVYRQAITSAGAGCMAALDADRFLKGIL
jgi:thioredoxin reductase (NADPH)